MTYVMNSNHVLSHAPQIYSEIFVEIHPFRLHHLYLSPQSGMTLLEFEQCLWHQKLECLGYHTALTARDGRNCWWSSVPFVQLETGQSLKCGPARPRPARRPAGPGCISGLLGRVSVGRAGFHARPKYEV